MPKKVKLVDYLTEDELRQKYRYCRDRVESRRWHLLWKISQSWTIKDSAAAVGISYEYAREIVRKYNAEGTTSVLNKRVKVVGLKPIIRRTWTLIGEKPQTIVQHRYEWLYVYSFVHPFSRATHWYSIPRVNVNWFNVVLANFAQSELANTEEQI